MAYFPCYVQSGGGGEGYTLYTAAQALQALAVGAYQSDGYGKRTFTATVGKHYLVITGHGSDTGQEFVSSPSWPLTGATIESYVFNGETSGAKTCNMYCDIIIIVATATTITYCCGNGGAYILQLD